MTDPDTSRNLQPLGLTVYDMPAPDIGSAEVAARTRRGRIGLLLVLLVCAAPILASYYTYFVVRPEGRTNHGDLITPQRPLPPLATTDLQGRTVPLSRLQGQWLLLVVASGECNAVCERMLFVQRQLHKMLHKDQARLARVWLQPDDRPAAPELLRSIDGALVLKVPRAELAQWLAPAPGLALEDHLYLVDQQGHWMMRFPFAKDAQVVAGIRRDLDRLMRASAVWHTPGR